MNSLGLTILRNVHPELTRPREFTLLKDVMLLMCSMVLIRSSYEIILISITDNPFVDNRTGSSDDLMCSRIRLF